MFFGADPFEHYGHPGGTGNGGGPSTNGNVDTSKLYDTLGIEKSADEKDIKKAFRKLA